MIGAAIGAGASDPGCRAGPAALRRCGLGRRDGFRWGLTIDADEAPPGAAAQEVVAAFSLRLAEAVRHSLSAGRLPLVIGGDHSCALGTWNGARAALAHRGRPGLIWIDAHLDCHTDETSHSGALHGMPLAALMGHGHRALVDIGGMGPVLDPHDVVIIGTRSHEPGEARLVERLGVRVISMREVRMRGFSECLREAIAYVSANTAAWGLSFDLDALDPSDAPGTGTPVAGGIALSDALSGIAGVGRHPCMLAAEIVEYNPYRDRDLRTAAAAIALADALRGIARQDEEGGMPAKAAPRPQRRRFSLTA